LQTDWIKIDANLSEKMIAAFLDIFIAKKSYSGGKWMGSKIGWLMRVLLDA
jgi:hypothetical protein